ncbi:MAG: protein translocase subunit SecF [Chloroflexi bacterium]|mgnify:CR=1 FL=1|nr:protein translocase subunit SecF [Chloroflexota bacterium]
MFTLIQKRPYYFLISTTLIVLSVVAMVVSTLTLGSPLRLSIDFTGGTLLEATLDRSVDPEDIRALLTDEGYEDATVKTVGDDATVSIRTRELTVAEIEALKAVLAAAYGPLTVRSSDTVGPTVGQETTRAAVYAILAAGVAILAFVAIAFRKVPNPIRYGACAIAKMFHDVIIMMGVCSMLGLVFNWEVDALFLTAVVTVVGFSVQDVIVVFDRVRENSARYRNEPYETIINRSLLETLHRSLATQLNSQFVMLAIILFGGATIRQFMAIMLIGMVTGTYSSLFFAVPLLVVWERNEWAHIFRRRPQMSTT